MNKINISPIGKIVNGNEVKVILDPKYAKALKGLEGYSHVQILWWMNGSDNQRDRNVLVEKKPYKNGPDEIGVFALRSPERPNPIAVTSSFSDFITRYTAVSSTNMKTETAEYYHLDPDDGLTLNLGVNPLLQFGLKETREQLCMNILNDLAVVDYVPFDSETIGNPALDLGDVIRFKGGQADENRISAITSMQCKIGGKHTLKGVGKNPRLAHAKSKKAAFYQIMETRLETQTVEELAELFSAVEVDFENNTYLYAGWNRKYFGCAGHRKWFYFKNGGDLFLSQQ